ncbi:MAG: hypothetical protein WAN82_00865 [Candidatus Bathyarchaeia archaeon]
MTGSTIDHLVSLMVFLGAILLFIGLFNQTIQTAILYQRHRSIATKCSDLLDNMLLNPGVPLDWGKSNCPLTGFGLQDPEFKQYRLSPFSLMRLHSSAGELVYYPKTDSYYSNITMGHGFLLVPLTEVINYSTATRLLGINGTYGFQLTITPIVTVSIEESQPKNPLILTVNVTGMGFPLANAAVSYCFLTVREGGGGGPYPSYTIEYGTDFTDEKGSVLLNFPTVKTDVSYVLIVYAHLSGLVGVGYYEHATYENSYVVPFIADLEERRVLIAHSWDVHGGSDPAEIAYNATFVLLTEDYTLREMPMENSTGKFGKINSGEGWPYYNITIPTYNPGILIISYRKSAQETGVVLMPWGISSMAFPVVFGEDPIGKEWVATDIRQVLVNNIAYQAKLALWSLQGYQVIG